MITIVYWRLIRPEKHLYDELRRQDVPGEPFIPIIGQLPQLNRARENNGVLAYLFSLSEKYGNYFLFSFGPLMRIMISEPDMIADVVGRSHVHDYVKPDVFGNIFKPLIGTHNLLVSEGEEHERARKMLNPAFHFINLKSMVSIMVNETAKVIDGFFLLSDSNAIDLHRELSGLTLSIIMSSAFGQASSTQSNFNQTMYQTVNDVFEAIKYRIMHTITQIPFLARLPFWRKKVIDDGVQIIGDAVDQIITDRRQGRSASLCAGSDLLDLLLSAIDSDGKSFTDEEIKQQALTFVLAGHETTNNLMAWAMYVLMTNESALRACREEVDKVLPNCISPSHELISSLVVCEAVLQETLRLYPPAPIFARKCVREHVIGKEGQKQLRIPVGTTIVINSYTLHRRADLWSRPHEFDYTRWLRDPVTDLKPKLAHPFCYLPFAAGSRNCIGQNFAMLEAKIMLAMLLQRCDFVMEPGQNIVQEFIITMRPKYGMRAQVSKRSKSISTIE
ncbi:unnamed protein product [Rotaria magnacalcarata]|uniref:Cytochrome P450 n=1 Tax=Rotaria magnacalcarata TaxID=392030 RepID=A0A816GHF5_9BILA|nr:unnamed protein product [Rotaria magnacalcarata]CAF1673605.1 unnamed protein product [Rotaria magnacalcarata]CAF1970254.1 unnamed protein product [Rotaria magnacalcarata]CAF4016737.1 unnamed protein product [Rotaria magnacalcarata]CAF4127636.1 unnamed protein product [Rotaria magnacalcarata]